MTKEEIIEYLLTLDPQLVLAACDILDSLQGQAIPPTVEDYTPPSV